MARICKACRQPVDDPRDHDCPEDREPEDGGSPLPAAALTVNVSGSVVSERDLLDTIQSAMLKRGH